MNTAGLKEILVFLPMLWGSTLACKGVSDLSKQLNEKKQVVMEIKIDGNFVKVGMTLDDVLAAVGRPDRTEPCMYGSEAAIRCIFHRQGNYYIFCFQKNEKQNVTLKVIDINGGY